METYFSWVGRVVELPLVQKVFSDLNGVVQSRPRWPLVIINKLNFPAYGIFLQQNVRWPWIYSVIVSQILDFPSLWFSPGTPVSSTNKTDDHDITEILSKVELNTIHQTYFFDISIWILILIFVCLFRILDGRKTFNLCHNVVSSTPCHEWDLNSQL
jgi:hypothetical protein